MTGAPGAGRAPSETGQEAIAPLASLPVFFRLAGKSVVVTGGSAPAAWKAELLAAAGARVRVIASQIGEKMLTTAERHPAIDIARRAWRPNDFAGAAMVVGDAGDVGEAEAIRAAAHAAGAPCNIIDRPEFCDFSFGAIVNRSPLVVGVSTDGASPVFGQAIRARIEAILPQAFRDWAEAARQWRPALAALNPSFRTRRGFWEKFVDRAIASDGRAPEEADFQALMLGLGETLASPGKGEAVLIGAGPGDPELLTMKAVRALQSADVILYDDLVSAGVLELARREARRINVGKRGHNPSVGQADISALLVQFGLEGKKVVRLKGGDPAVFGRLNEETAAARAAGIACTIIPGVTAALAAAAALGVSLSERDRARRIQFITAHAADGALPQRLDWSALIDADAATCVYMGVKTLPALVARLLSEGLDPKTPAAMVENASLPQARRIIGAIADMPALIAAIAPSGPCMLLYGRTIDRAMSDA